MRGSVDVGLVVLLSAWVSVGIDMHIARGLTPARPRPHSGALAPTHTCVQVTLLGSCFGPATPLAPVGAMFGRPGSEQVAVTCSVLNDTVMSCVSVAGELGAVELTACWHVFALCGGLSLERWDRCSVVRGRVLRCFGAVVLWP